jgi:hypothetical protein
VDSLFGLFPPAAAVSVVLAPVLLLLLFATIAMSKGGRPAGVAALAAAVVILLGAFQFGVVVLARLLIVVMASAALVSIGYGTFRYGRGSPWYDRYRGAAVIGLLLAAALGSWNWQRKPPPPVPGVAMVVIPVAAGILSLLAGWLIQRSENRRRASEAEERAGERRLAEEERARLEAAEAARRARLEAKRAQREKEEQEELERKQLAAEQRAREREELRLADERRAAALAREEEEALERARQADLRSPYPEMQARDRAVLERLTALDSIPESAGIPLAEVADAVSLPIDVVYASLLRAREFGHASVTKSPIRQTWSDIVVSATRDGRFWLQRTGRSPIVNEISNSWIANANFGHIGGDNLQNIGTSNYHLAQKDSIAHLMAEVQAAKSRAGESALGDLERELTEAVEGSADPRSLANQVIGIARTLGEVGVPLMEAARRVIEVFTQ